MNRTGSNGKPDILNAVRMAFGFLSVLPVPQKKEWSDLDFGWSAVFYPAVGALIGAAAGWSFSLLDRVLERAPAAFLTLIIWILLSGALHWDGLADCFDGFCCSASPERRLEIMKDSRLGTFGALGVFCSLILKWLCIWFLPASKGPLFFALIGASARWAMLFLTGLPLANPNGLAAMLQKHCPKRIVLYASPLPVLLAILNGAGSAIAYPVISVLTAGLLALTAKRKIGGISGDVLGFTIELSEIVMLLCAMVIP